MKERSGAADKDMPKPTPMKGVWHESINFTACIIAFMVLCFITILVMFVLASIEPDAFIGKLFDVFLLVFSLAGSAAASWFLTARYYRKGRDKELQRYGSVGSAHLRVVCKSVVDISDRIDKEITKVEEGEAELGKETILRILENVRGSASGIREQIDFAESIWRNMLADDIETYGQQREQRSREYEQEIQRLQEQFLSTSSRLDQLMEQKGTDQKQISALEKELGNLTSTIKDMRSQQESIAPGPFPPRQSPQIERLMAAADHRAKAYRYNNEHDFDRAIQELDKAIELEPDNALAYVNRAYTYIKKGDNDQAIQDCDKAIELDSDNSTAYVNRSGAYIGKGDPDQAIQDCDKAIELDSGNASAYVSRASAYIDKGDPDQAIQDCNKAIELDSGNASAYVNRASAHIRKGDLDQGIQDCDKAIELDSGNASAYVNRASAYGKKGDLGQGIQDCDKAIELDPDNALAYNNRCYAYAKKGNFDRGIQDCDKAIELDPERAESYASRGYACIGKRDLDRAMQDCSKAIELDPDIAEAYFDRGRTWFFKGDRNSAIADFGRATEIDADYEKKSEEFLEEHDIA